MEKYNHYQLTDGQDCHDMLQALTYIKILSLGVPCDVAVQ